MTGNRPITAESIARLTESESTAFARKNPKSAALAERAKNSLFGGVPMHWMNDWPTPFPLFVAEAKGPRFTDADGHVYVDFCLGDTGAMFGHSPDAVANAVKEQATRGYTTMLPGEDAVWVGEELRRRFGLQYWQMTATATDANRYALRWARAITERSVILVFDGCYHGTVEETMVRLRGGVTVWRHGQIGALHNYEDTTRIVDFNDLPALDKALKSRDVAAVLCEPAMTNIGMVLPQPGFHQSLRAMTRETGALLIVDETHTMSTGPGGWTGAFHLEPDMLVVGKAIAGGIPAAVLGVTADVAQRMTAVREKMAAEHEDVTHGHSGMGTTLSGNAFAMHAMRANLEHVMTKTAYARMIVHGERLADALWNLFTEKNLQWSVSQVGGRLEFQFCPVPPRTGRDAEAAFNPALEHCIHLYLLNRGVLITPFHNMILISPETTLADIDRLTRALTDCIDDLRKA